jgi:hypothetical protein
MLATVFCFSVSAQTINVMALDQAGAQTVLQAAKESAQQRNAPSAIAVVDPAVDLLAFQRMDTGRLLGRLIRISRKLPTGEQPFRQKPSGLKPDLHGERCIPFFKRRLA